MSSNETPSGGFDQHKVLLRESNRGDTQGERGRWAVISRIVLFALLTVFFLFAGLALAFQPALRWGGLVLVTLALGAGDRAVYMLMLLIAGAGGFVYLVLAWWRFERAQRARQASRGSCRTRNTCARPERRCSRVAGRLRPSYALTEVSGSTAMTR